MYGRIHHNQALQTPRDTQRSSALGLPPPGVTLLTGGVTVQGVDLPPTPSPTTEDWRDFSAVDPSPSAPVVYPTLHLSDGRTLRCRLLVGSDGAASSIQRAMPTPVIGWEYSQRAVVCNVQLQPSPSGPLRTAYQRFLPSGPIAMLPCHADFASIIWSTSPQHAQQLCAMEGEELARPYQRSVRQSRG